MSVYVDMKNEIYLIFRTKKKNLYHRDAFGVNFGLQSCLDVSFWHRKCIIFHIFQKCKIMWIFFLSFFPLIAKSCDFKHAHCKRLKSCSTTYLYDCRWSCPAEYLSDALGHILQTSSSGHSHPCREVLAPQTSLCCPDPAAPHCCCSLYCNVKRKFMRYVQRIKYACLEKNNMPLLIR